MRPVALHFSWFRGLCPIIASKFRACTKKQSLVSSSRKIRLFIVQINQNQHSSVTCVQLCASLAMDHFTNIVDYMMCQPMAIGRTDTEAIVFGPLLFYLVSLLGNLIPEKAQFSESNIFSLLIRFENNLTRSSLSNAWPFTLSKLKWNKFSKEWMAACRPMIQLGYSWCPWCCNLSKGRKRDPYLAHVAP